MTSRNNNNTIHSHSPVDPNPPIITQNGQQVPVTLTKESVQKILMANSKLIQLCVQLQNDPSPQNQQELVIVQAKLQQNLKFLASLVDFSSVNSNQREP
ncbi:hypothetical protein MP228_003023 [Amoeboaphelidium protococcarum]|nr:hypothetical protein MP228_003023 [Amoeboaphelidium protococcarum]